MRDVDNAIQKHILGPEVPRHDPFECRTALVEEDSGRMGD